MKSVAAATIGIALCATATLAEEFTVTMSGTNYAPDHIAAVPGDTIRFVNDDGFDHNVFVPTASHALDLGAQEPGEERTLVLRTPGTFDVECVIHSHMLMTVEVSE